MLPSTRRSATPRRSCCRGSATSRWRALAPTSMRALPRARVRAERRSLMSTADGATDFLRAFSDPEAVARYLDGPRRFVPGLADLHRMTGILLAERAPADARVLVLGAGGGLEIKALGEAHPGWSFVGVDPS